MGKDTKAVYCAEDLWVRTQDRGTAGKDTKEVYRAEEQQVRTQRQFIGQGNSG